jgi:hypothetical protein
MLIGLEGVHAFYESIFGGVERIRNFRAFAKKGRLERSRDNRVPNSAQTESMDDDHFRTSR